MRDIRLHVEQRLAVHLEVHLPFSDGVMTRGMHIAPQTLQAIGIRKARRPVSGDKHFNRLAAVLRDERRIDPDSGALVPKTIHLRSRP